MAARAAPPRSSKEAGRLCDTATEAAVRAGLAGLLTRKIIREAPEGYQMVPEQAAALCFYANSIAHLDRRNSAAAQ